MLERILAIDWSGSAAVRDQRQHIWMDDWHRGTITLTSGRTRDETTAVVIAASRETPALVVGIDFAFCYPEWFLTAQGCSTAAAMWQQATLEGDRWLRECEPPFWGRARKLCPLDHRGPQWNGYRATEREFQRDGRLPSSPFQVGGAGAVGTGSVRGMPHLLTLMQQGFAIWPFDAPRLPIALEIYPRLFTGRTRVSDARCRAEHLQRSEFANLPAEVLGAAPDSADAFDALCALLGMVTHADQLETLAAKPERAREGEIWKPCRL